MTTEHIIFVGFQLTDESKEQLVDSGHRDRIYLEDPSYLETVVIDGHEYVGKRTTGGIAIDRLDDIARNVVSLMRRVSQKWDTPSRKALIIACEPDESTPAADGGDTAGFDYTGLMD